MDAQVVEGLRRVDAALARMRPYEDVLAALEEVAGMPGAGTAALAIAQTRFTIALVYDRPMEEVEATLVGRLAADDNPETRTYAAGAAYATYPALRPHFEAVVAELEALPRTELVERLLGFVERVRANVATGGSAAGGADGA